ncbi:MAG: hypothetical protein WBS15_26525, partial [Mycobacterium sp.]
YRPVVIASSAAGRAQRVTTVQPVRSPARPQAGRTGPSAKSSPFGQRIGVPEIITGAPARRTPFGRTRRVLW